MVYLDKFSDTLKEIMEEQSWNEKDFSKNVGIDQTSLSLYISKKRAPTIQNIVKIADYFNCSVDFLLGEKYDSTVHKFNSPAPFPERLEYLKKTLKISYYKMYNGKNIAKTSFYSWKRGESYPSLDNVISLSKNLNCSIDFIIGRTDIQSYER